ncbi:MAG: VOC family protein [Gammaproteobacteria bacterium]|nr:VOC family protein [Gammaproteobacteria bacterium]
MKNHRVRPDLLGLHHVALQTSNYDATRAFYVDIFGMNVEWEPDADNVYLTTGSDNLAIHRVAERADFPQLLDHIGFIVPEAVDVDAWHEYLVEHDVEIVSSPRTHRDGARSFYCVDPAGVQVQVIHHPPLSGKRVN